MKNILGIFISVLLVIYNIYLIWYFINYKYEKKANIKEE